MKDATETFRADTLDPVVIRALADELASETGRRDYLDGIRRHPGFRPDQVGADILFLAHTAQQRLSKINTIEDIE